jgi:signal peptidase I
METSQTELKVETPPKTKTKKPKSFWREVIETLILTVIIFFLVQLCISHRLVRSVSMQPNLYEDYRLIVNKVAYFQVDLNNLFGWFNGGKSENPNIVFPFGGLQRGDIVVLHREGQEDDLIKRLIGLPGEKLEIKNGKVYINDKLLPENYVKGTPTGEYPATVIPAGYAFVMGDNRNSSSDSRSFGAVPVSALIGKAEFRYYPFGDGWGFFSRPSYST